MRDTLDIKDRILNTIKIRGPCLPVHIAKSIGMSILFTSAFLSELLSEKEIRISHMKVGSSSVHYIPGQEQKLENFSQYLKSREKDAYELLRERKFLKDSEQEPAIRVALRAIKDFAIPFKRGEEIIWRYFTTKEDEFIPEPKPEPKVEIKKIEDKKEPEKTFLKKVVEIFDKSEKKEEKEEKKIEQKKPKKQVKKKTNSLKKDEKFFNNVKEFLSKESIEILDIIGFNKNSLILKVKKNNQEILIIAHNKKRIEEGDIINANKKASEFGLKYSLLFLGDVQKKLKSFIEALKNLHEINKIE